ncbi:DUF2804 domain-containing protein [Hyphomonas sp. WL0036]|uniref:DUF2804 domain-containing protein n=1 Tax=Hyphomonas sediminis TaxID=2866160 RepID=UPI001C815CAF|nr:DUF2804 domain-containing protein [Hyphomonas sediminis]MBY9065839.1 DUF2804 domain-containing protein [Hyphomonas sediminis]
MQKKMGTGPLLDAKGHLAECGWSNSEVRSYDRAAIRANALRIKEWDYYCILTPEYGLALTVADNGYLGFLGVSWIDLRARKATNHGAATFWPMGKMNLPASADSGDIDQSASGVSLAFRHEAGGRRLKVDAPGFDNGAGLSGELWLAQPPMDRMVIATPFPRAPKAFYYNQKINCLPAEGKITVGGETFAFTPTAAYGVLDWGRGVWTYSNTWYWGSASGRQGKDVIGFNIGYGFGDTSAASENMFFLNGKAHKLDQVTFHMPCGKLDEAPWKFSSNDGRFTMDFKPAVNRHHTTNLGIFKTAQDQVFGHFSGNVGLDDGSLFHVERLPGFAEEVRNRW